MASLWIAGVKVEGMKSKRYEDDYIRREIQQPFPGNGARKLVGTAIRPSMLYGAECRSTKRRHVQQLSVAEMRMLLWFCEHTRRDREKLTQHRLRWFGHVQRRPPKVPVHCGVLKWIDNVKRGRGRPKLTWDESVKRNLKEWNISKVALSDKSAWRLAINVPEP
ncbi:hypothetical protein PVAP13_6NG192309 [Panicum virgatum]|uniref:Uncharacterized protein n=1 Tax=Panicum virgatum TaxID=38727 RepID=A0A8T0QWN3_PANVG|nr:hypothetical protein PVAP13_6NG192309 [Panicum virgatum]